MCSSPRCAHHQRATEWTKSAGAIEAGSWRMNKSMKRVEAAGLYVFIPADVLISWLRAHAGAPSIPPCVGSPGDRPD